MQMFGMDVEDDVIRGAVTDLAAALVDSEDALGHMTCREIDELARSLARLGMQDEGESLIITHTLMGDGPSDDGHGSLVTDDGTELAKGAQAAVRAHVEALCGETVEPGAPVA